MKLGRLVRKLDDVAEVLIFDVLLATRRRRLVAGTLAAVAGLALYVFSGFLLPTAPYMLSVTLDSKPAIDDKTWSTGSGKAMDVAVDFEIRPGDVAPLTKDLEAQRRTLNGIVELTSRGTFTFPNEPCFKYVREAANMLVARGVLTGNEGNYSGAIDFRAAARLGRSVGRGANGRGLLIDAMIGVACERVAVRAMTKVARDGRMSDSAAAIILADLSARPRQVDPLEMSLRSERDYLLGIVARWVKDGSLPLEFAYGTPLRLWLPVRAGARRVTGARMEALIRDAYARMETKARALDGEQGTRDVLLQLCSTCTSGGRLTMIPHALGGVFSNELAAHHATFWLLSNFMPNMHAAFKRWDRREREVDQLAALCRARLAGLPPSTVAPLADEPWMHKAKRP
jgi:hypothetical protein